MKNEIKKPITTVKEFEIKVEKFKLIALRENEEENINGGCA